MCHMWAGPAQVKRETRQNGGSQSVRKIILTRARKINEWSKAGTGKKGGNRGMRPGVEERMGIPNVRKFRGTMRKRRYHWCAVGVQNEVGVQRK